MKYIFFFSTNSVDTKFELKKIIDKKQIAKLITINMTSFKLKVDEQILLEILNGIINDVDVYELILPFDMSDFPTTLLNELRKQK